jgi:hypothetical protein
MIAAGNLGLTTKIDRLATSFRSELDGLGKRVDGISSGLGSQIAEVAGDVDNLRRKANEDSESIKRRLRQLEEKPLVAPTSTKNLREESAYWEARCCLRLCPIGQDTKRDLEAFLVEVLKLDRSLLDRLPLQAVKKLPPGRDKRYTEEAVIKFGSVGDRDMVRSSAIRLAGFEKHSIRLELPNHLLSQHRVLSTAAQRLRQSNKGARTVIKFDDDNLSLALDYRVSQEDSWMRLHPEQAAEISRMQGLSVGTNKATAEDFAKLLTPQLTGGNTATLGAP